MSGVMGPAHTDSHDQGFAGAYQGAAELRAAKSGPARPQDACPPNRYTLATNTHTHTHKRTRSGVKNHVFAHVGWKHTADLALNSSRGFFPVRLDKGHGAQ